MPDSSPVQSCIEHIIDTMPPWYPAHLWNMLILLTLTRVSVEVEPVLHGYSRHCTEKTAGLVGMNPKIVI